MSVYDLLANLHEEAGEYSEAIECLERAASITSSNNTDRLRRIAELAEAVGDRSKAISSLKRVLERTRQSCMLKVDDYLALTRSLLEERRVDEAAKVADDMRVDTKNIPSGELASEVAAAMIHRGKGEMNEAKTCMNRISGLVDNECSTISDAVAIEIAEEATHHGDVERASSIIANLSIKSILPNKIRKRLTSWFGANKGNNPGKASDNPDMDKELLSEKIVFSMVESMKTLEESWSESIATNTREILIEAFTLMPRDKRVIHAHIRYNSIAVRHGGKRHSPTTRTLALTAKE